MIYLVTSHKGGSGKTTISTGLACLLSEKESTLIVDTDDQKLSEKWYGMRDEKKDKNLSVISLTEPLALKKNLPILKERYKNIIIDGAPKLDASNAITIFFADCVVIPVYLSPLDIWSAQEFVSRIRNAQEIRPELKACFLLNRWNDRAAIAKDILNLLTSSEDFQAIPVLKNRLANRLAYPNAMFSGETALNWDVPKARIEFNAALNEIISLAKSNKK